MPTPPVTNERLLEVLEARRTSKSAKEAGAKLIPPIAETTVKCHLKTAALRGLAGFKPVMHGFEVASVSTAEDNKTGKIVRTYVRQRPERGEDFVPTPGMALQKTTVEVGPDGKINRSWPRYATEEKAEDIAAEIRAGLLDLKGLAPFVAAPVVAREDLMVGIYIADAHLAQRSWEEHVGVNYDLKIAEEQICGAYDESLARAPIADTALIAVLGDYCHADDDTNMTPVSKHVLDVDSRHGKTRRVASRCLKYKIERTRERFRNVIFRYIPGNHDPKSAGWLSHALWLYYDGADGVTIDDNQGPFGFYEFGAVMNGLFHGDKIRQAQFKDAACSRQAEMWGRTKFRYGHSGHKHKSEKIRDEFAGMIVTTHQAVTAPDGYAYDNFPATGRSIDTVVYHRHSGEYCSFSVPILGREKL